MTDQLDPMSPSSLYFERVSQVNKGLEHESFSSSPTAGSRKAGLVANTTGTPLPTVSRQDRPLGELSLPELDDLAQAQWQAHDHSGFRITLNEMERRVST